MLDTIYFFNRLFSYTLLLIMIDLRFRMTASSKRACSEPPPSTKCLWCLTCLSSLAQESHTLRSNQHFVRTSFFETYNTVPMCKSLSPPAESPIIIKLSGLLLLSACSYTGVLFNIEFLYHSYWKFFPYKLSSLFHVLLQITTCILL